MSSSHIPLAEFAKARIEFVADLHLAVQAGIKAINIFYLVSRGIPS